MLSLLAFIYASQSVAQTLNQPSLKTIVVRTREGTELGFDLSQDGRSIVFDLLGQLWLFPADGGKARPITDAVRDAAEDLDPSFAPDGRAVVFRGERNGRTGLWLLRLDNGPPRQLTQLPNPDGFDGSASWSPDGRLIAFVHEVPPDANGSRWRTAIMLLDVASGNVRELSVTSVPNPRLSDPVWVQGGRRIAFISRSSGAAAQSLILKQQRIEEKRLFLTRCGRRIAVHVETSPRDSLLRRQWRVRSARSNQSGRRPAQGRPGWRLAKVWWRAQERPGGHFEPAIPSASGKTQRRDSDDPQPDCPAAKSQGHPPPRRNHPPGPKLCHLFRLVEERHASSSIRHDEARRIAVNIAKLPELLARELIRLWLSRCARQSI